MKKTLLILAFAFPFLGFSQTFDFNNDLQGFNGASGFDAVASSTSAVLTGKITGGPFSNPQFSNSTSNINATTNKMLKVVLKNSNVAGPEYLRASYPKADLSGAVYKDISITRGDSNFKTYYIDLTDNINWINTINDFKLIFKATGNTNYTVLGGETIEIDQMSFFTPGTKSTYEFDIDGDSELFTATGAGASISTTGGKMIWTMTATSGQDFLQNLYTADLLNNRYVHVFYTNNSANVQLRMSYKTSTGAYASAGQNVSILASSSGEAILDLTTKTDLTSDMNMKFNPRVSGTTQATGTLEIDRIVINNTSSTLATGDISKAKNILQVYLTEKTLNFRNANVTKATIFTMNGQTVKDANVLNNKLDVSSLKAGVYMVKAIANDQSISISKFIVK